MLEVVEVDAIQKFACGVGLIIRTPTYQTACRSRRFSRTIDVYVNRVRYRATQNCPVLECRPFGVIAQRCCCNMPQAMKFQSGEGLVVEYRLFEVPQFSSDTRTSDKLFTFKYSSIVWKYFREKATK